MPAVDMTARWIETLKPPASGQVDYFDRRQPGLVLRVGTRRRVWYAVYRPKGAAKVRRVKLEQGWPELSLADARTLAAQTMGNVAGGGDPAAERQAKKRAPTFGALAKEFLERRAAGLRSEPETRRIIETELLPAWGDRKAADIRRRDVIERTDKIVDRGRPVAANRTASLVRRIFNFGIDRELVDHNPAFRLKPGGKEAARERALSEDEIPAFWNGLDKIKMDARTRAALRLLLCTGQRPGEIAEMRRSEIEAAWWTIPPERSKNRRAHRVFLNSVARRIIAEIPDDGDFLFPSPHGEGPIRRHALSRALLRGWEKQGDAPPVFDGIPRFRPHDLRRSASTGMARAGIAQSDIDRVLNHAQAGIGAVYNRYAYDAEKRAAMERWGEELERIIAGKPAEKIFTMKRRQSR
jgi:integrase